MQGTNKKNSVEHMVIGESTLNVKILWALKMVKSHLSFRSCIDLSKLFLCMFKFLKNSMLAKQSVTTL